MLLGQAIRGVVCSSPSVETGGAGFALVATNPAPENVRSAQTQARITWRWSKDGFVIGTQPALVQLSAALPSMAMVMAPAETLQAWQRMLTKLRTPRTPASLLWWDDWSSSRSMVRLHPLAHEPLLAHPANPVGVGAITKAEEPRCGPFRHEPSFTAAALPR